MSVLRLQPLGVPVRTRFSAPLKLYLHRVILELHFGFLSRENRVRIEGKIVILESQCLDFRPEPSPAVRHSGREERNRSPPITFIGFADVAQLARASPCHGEGCVSSSLIIRSKKIQPRYSGVFPEYSV